MVSRACSVFRGSRGSVGAASYSPGQPVGFASTASRYRGTPQKLRRRRARATRRDGSTKHLNAGTSPATGPASRPRRGRPMHLHTVRRSTRRSSRRPMTASFVFWEPSRVDGVAAPPPREQLRRRRESNINARAGSTPRTSPRRRRRPSRRRRPRRAPRRIPPTPPRWTPPSSPRADSASLVFGSLPPTGLPRRWRGVSMASRACSVGFASMASRRRRRGTPQKLRCRRERATTRKGSTKHLTTATTQARTELRTHGLSDARAVPRAFI